MRGRVLRGVGWKAMSQLVFQASRIAVAVILARLLSPHDYGLAGMVMVVGLFALVFSDLAFGAAIVQRAHLTEDDRSTVFWASIAAGVFFTSAGIALAGPLAAFYGEPEVRPLFAALSVSFLITSIGSIQTALLTREMEFRRLEIRQIAATLCGAIVGISLAFGGAGAWAIIGQQLTVAVVSSALVWLLVDWKPMFRFSGESIRRLGGFSSKVFGQRLLYYASRSADGILIGRFLGATAVGIYAVAYNVILIPFSQIAGPIQQVMFPAFARMQEDLDRVAAVWIRTMRLIAAVTMPALLGMIVVAPDFVSVILGDKWSAAVPVLRILAFVAILQSLQTMNADILQALDKAGTMLRFMIVWFAANLTAFVIGLQWGIVGVASAYAVAAAFLEPANAWLTTRALGTSLSSVVRGISGVAQAAVGMALIVAGARQLALELSISPLLRLVALIGLGVVVYLPLCAWRSPAARRDVLELIRRSKTTSLSEPQPLSEPQL